MGKQKYNKKRDFVYNEGYIIDQLCCSIIKSTLLHNFCYNFSNIQFFFFMASIFIGYQLAAIYF